MIANSHGIALDSRDLPPGLAAAWRRDVQGLLARIAAAWSGAAVLAAVRWHIENTSNELVIMPLHPSFPQDNPQTGMVLGAKASTVQIGLSPASLPRKLADAFLLHELLHGVRRLSGHHRKSEDCACVYRGAMQPFTNREELLAIMVENIYRADDSRRGRALPLRASHQNLGAMPPELASSLRFFATGHQVFHHVQRFTREHPVLSRRLAATRATFNPLAAIFADPQGAFRMSLGSDREALRYAEVTFGEIDFQRYKAGPVVPPPRRPSQ